MEEVLELNTPENRQVLYVEARNMAKKVVKEVNINSWETFGNRH